MEREQVPRAAASESSSDEAERSSGRRRPAIPEGVNEHYGVVDRQFAAATAGPASALPHREHMESVFGESFSGVETHLGQAAALGTMGAAAAASAERLAFAGDAPGKAEVAHELAHVVQHRRGAGSAALSNPGDCAEREAHGVAARAAAGHPVRVVERASASVHRLLASDLDELKLQHGEESDAKGKAHWVRVTAQQNHALVARLSKRSEHTSLEHLEDNSSKVPLKWIFDDEGAAAKSQPPAGKPVHVGNVQANGGDAYGAVMEPANAGNASAPNAAIVLKQQPGRPIMNRAPGDAGETFKRATALLAEAADRLSHADLPRFVQECRLLGVDEIEVGTWTDEILATEYAISDGEERAQILLLQKLFIDAPPQTSVAAPAADIDKVVAHDGKAVGVLAGTPPRSDAKQQPAQKKVQEEAKPLVHGHVAGHLLINDLHGNVHIGKATGVMHVSLIDLSAQPGAPAGAAGPEHKNDLPALGSLNLGDVGGSVHIAEVAGTIAVTGAIQGGHIVVADSQITAVHITHVAAKKAPGAGPKESVAAVSQDGSAVDQAGLHIESNGTGDRPPVINVGGIQGTNVDVIGYIHRMLAGKK